MLGYLLFLVFAPVVWAAVRRDEHEATGALTALATAYVTLSLAATACLAPALNRGEDAAAAAGFLDLRTTL